MKQCFKCKETKQLIEFYKHNQMADGYLNKCKSCARQDSSKNRTKNIDYYREADRKRGRRQTKEYIAEYRNRFPNKYKAQTMVGNAIRGKKLFKELCEVCGTDGSIHAHHDDYLKPLNVRWLCAVHHNQWHAENGAGKNGN